MKYNDFTLDQTIERLIKATDLHDELMAYHQTLIDNSACFDPKEYERIFRNSQKNLALAERRKKELEGILVFANRLEERLQKKGGYL